MMLPPARLPLLPPARLSPHVRRTDIAPLLCAFRRAKRLCTARRPGSGFSN